MRNTIGPSNYIGSNAYRKEYLVIQTEAVYGEGMHLSFCTNPKHIDDSETVFFAILDDEACRGLIKAASEYLARAPRTGRSDEAPTPELTAFLAAMQRLADLQERGQV
jgi:hypothetical protein